jgi:hypothetical protein
MPASAASADIALKLRIAFSHFQRQPVSSKAFAEILAY